MGPSPESEQASDRPQQFGRYIIEAQLGKGAMGEVYLAHDPVLDRKIALKVINLDHNLDQQTREDFFARFSSEAKSSAKLNHPSIVSVYDAGEENNLPWIAFQFVEGETLEKLLARRGRLPIKRVVAFSLDIASALQHAHGWNIVHRDIKPANILIENRTGIAMLADFGIAKTPWTGGTQEGEALGSPGYMSPEQLEGSDLDERTDLFSLGVVIYQMISGKHPFIRDSLRATAFATCKGEYTALRDLVGDVPLSLDRVVRRCLFADRRMRVKSALDLIGMLKEIEKGDLKPGSSGERASSILPSKGKESGSARRDARLIVMQTRLRAVWKAARHWLRCAWIAAEPRLRDAQRSMIRLCKLAYLGGSHLVTETIRMFKEKF
jgi:serine/threonine-protein kinase